MASPRTGEQKRIGAAPILGSALFSFVAAFAASAQAPIDLGLDYYDRSKYDRYPPVPTFDFVSYQKELIVIAAAAAIAFLVIGRLAAARKRPGLAAGLTFLGTLLVIDAWIYYFFDGRVLSILALIHALFIR